MNNHPSAETRTEAVDLAVRRSVAMLEAAPQLVEMLREYAHECERCKGSGEIPGPDDDEFVECDWCKPIHELIKQAMPPELYRKPATPIPQRVVQQEPEDDIEF